MDKPKKSQLRMKRKLQPVAVGVGQLDMYMARMTNQQQQQREK